MPQGGQGALFDVAPGASAQQDPAQDVLSDRAGNATSPVGHAISAGLITAAQVDALRAFRPALTPDFVAAHVAIANAYEALPQYDPAAIPAYRALAAETERQYRAITGEGGLRVTAWRGEGEPYASSQEMLADIKRGHIYFFTTEAGFGTENGGAAFDERNPLLVGTNVTVVDTNGEPHTMLVNDMFRVVHDYIAHGVTESSFGPLGEERAWAAHMATIEHPDARRALTTETRGQNSWVNFGPHIRRADGTVPTRGDADFVPQQNRPFAPQKTALLPDDVVMADAPPHARAQTSPAANDRAAYDEAKAAGRTKLNYSQWVQVRTPAFKAWFGDWENDPANASKVVDSETGEPLVVYHGTGEGGFTVFDRNSWRTAYGNFFTPDKEAAEGYNFGRNPETYATFLAAKKLLDLRGVVEDGHIGKNKWLADFAEEQFDTEYGDAVEQMLSWLSSGDMYSVDGRKQDALMAAAEEHGYDGVAMYDAKVGGGIASSFIVFEPTQIKSATGNNGDFSPSEGSVLADRAPRNRTPSQAPAPTPVQVQTSTAANILTNTPATPAGNIALVRNPKTRREGLRKYASMLKTALVSGLTPVEEAIDNIPARLSAHRDALMAAMWNAPDRRDYMLDLAMRNYGGNDLMRKLGAMATRRKVSAETVQQEVGYYLTAVYAQTKAQRMMEADQQAVDEATLALRKAKTPAAKATAQKALDAATKIRDDRAHAYATGDETTAEHFGPGGERAQEELKAAIAELDALRVDPNASDADIAAADMRVATARADLEQHRVGLVAGMPEAQVLKTIAAARAKYGRAALDSAARDMYRLMAFRTAIDLESGRLQVDTAKLYSPEMEEVEAEMRALVDGVNDPRTTPAKMEVLRRALVNKLAATSTYVPTTGSPDAKPDTDVFGSGTRAPNVATEKRLEGRSSGRAQDGIAAGMSAIYRASSGYGWRPFTGGIEALYHAATTDERQAMGMGTPSPITALQRLGDNVIIHGKWGYKFGGDEVMQALRRENEDGRSAIVKAIALPTQAMAYMMTQLSPPFAVKNMIRDVWERTENLRARELKDANGKVLDSDKIAREALGIAMRGKMFNEIRKFMWSGEGANSEGARYLQEATAAGFGGSRRVHQLPNTRRDLKGEIEHAMSKPARAFSALKVVAERWNMLFDNVAPLSIYIAMRKAGMTKEQAAFQTKDLMNFRKQGASMAFPRAIWAFAQPAATGAHQLLRSLNTRRGLVRATAYVAGFWAIQSMLAAMGGDDDDLKRKRTDLLDEFTRDRALGIPLPDGGMAKLPVGMGYPAIANSIANILRGSPLGSGENEWRDVATDLINRSIMPAFSPLDDSKIAGDDAPAAAFVQTLAPTAFEPVINVAIGRTSFGKKIVREEFLDPDVNKALQGAPNTAEFYKDVAKTILQISGGTVDYAPEEVKALFSGYAVGLPREALKFAVTNKTLEQMGKEANVPILDSFYMASNPNAVFGELSAFDERGMTLVKRMTRELPDDISDKDRDDEIRNRLHTLENPRDRRELELYLDYREVKNGFRDEASALTKSGVAKGSGPERDALQHERGQANVLFLNRWYDVRSRD